MGWGCVGGGLILCVMHHYCIIKMSTERQKKAIRANGEGMEAEDGKGRRRRAHVNLSRSFGPHQLESEKLQLLFFYFFFRTYLGLFCHFVCV